MSSANRKSEKGEPTISLFLPSFVMENLKKGEGNPMGSYFGGEGKLLPGCVMRSAGREVVEKGK